MKPVATYQKLRGGYYTPKPIADFLTNWAIQTPDTTVLEPSCGDGTILAINESHAAHVETGDFFTYCQSYLAQERFFDAVIGNPDTALKRV